MDRSCTNRHAGARKSQPSSPPRYQLLILAIVLFLPSCIRWEHLAERMGGDTRALYRISYSIDGSGNWVDATTYDVPPPPVKLTMRVPVVIDDQQFDDGTTAGLMISALAKSEVLWDGQPIGVARDIDTFFALTREQSSPGSHLLTLRLATLTPAPETWFYGIGIGDYERMVRSRITSQIGPMIAVGAFLIVSVWYLALWSSLRRRSLLIFAMLSAAAALLGFAEGYRLLFGYPVEWHVMRLRAISVLTFAVSLLLPWFLALEMGTRRPLLRLGALACVLMIALGSPSSYDSACLVMFVHSMIASIAIVIAAVPERGWRILPQATGISVLGGALVAGGFRFSDHGFFLAFSALIVCLVISLSLDLRRDRVRAARVEAELLKKSIQPHFIMNTLTAVMEWIEENPKEGVRFLQSLADELRIFFEIAGRPLIPVRRELELCRAHLEIMSCRKGVRFELDAEGLEEDRAVPPAIFHTLVENAISHNSYADERVAFRLREERRNGSCRYVFTAPVRERETKRQSGVGMRYVTTRLEESFPGRWRVDSFLTGDSWETAIEVPG